jgi:hypothetical protein
MFRSAFKTSYIKRKENIQIQDSETEVAWVGFEWDVESKWLRRQEWSYVERW